jgi:hypothetical protein
MPEPRGTAARGQVFTTPLFRIFGVKNLDFIGDLPGRPRENSQKPLPVSKVGLTQACAGGLDQFSRLNIPAKNLVGCGAGR